MTTYIHIHAPKADMCSLKKRFCPTCKKPRFMTAWHTPYYGWDMTCLKCGEEWSDGEMRERPFMPAWRKKNVAAAKNRWRAQGAKS